MIELKNIGKVYERGNSRTEVLKDVNLTIERGEYVAIMGPSGSGKSTLMNIIGALDVPTSGQYLFDGRDVAQYSEDELADFRMTVVGFVFQSFNLLPRATVVRNVILPLIYDRRYKPAQRRELAVKALESVNLDPNRYEHMSNQLSGGQMQRVAIARALVNDPAILLADEPTGNLDTKTGDLVMDTIGRLNQEQGRTVIVITHEREIAERSRRIIHIRDGQIGQDERL
ncbi:MAG: ABC transporter ATP-binding protein [Patescibacteria group bacterium]